MPDRPRVRFAPIEAGLVLAALVSGQALSSKPGYRITKIDVSGGVAGLLVSHDNGRGLNPGEVPRLGSDSATNYIVSLFDYTCVHCRALHPLQFDISLYVATAQSIGDARLPQLMIGDVITHGAVGTVAELSKLIARHTPLTEPANRAELPRP